MIYARLLVIIFIFVGLASCKKKPSNNEEPTQNAQNLDSRTGFGLASMEALKAGLSDAMHKGDLAKVNAAMAELQSTYPKEGGKIDFGALSKAAGADPLISKFGIFMGFLCNSKIPLIEDTFKILTDKLERPLREMLPKTSADETLKYALEAYQDKTPKAALQKAFVDMLDSKVLSVPYETPERMDIAINQKIVNHISPSYIKLIQSAVATDNLEKFAFVQDALRPLEIPYAESKLNEIFGPGKWNHVTGFDFNKPLGKASVGVVYAVEVDGRRYAAKILRPQYVIDSPELTSYKQQHLDVIDYLTKKREKLIERQGPLLDAALAESKAAIAEIDLTIRSQKQRFATLIDDEIRLDLEGKNLDAFAAQEKSYDLKGGKKRRTVSTVGKGNFTSPKGDFLVMDIAEGKTLSGHETEIKKMSDGPKKVLYEKRLKGLLESTMMEIIDRQMMGGGLFHGDPHGGNMVIDVEARKVTLIDAGASGRLPEADQKMLIKLFAATELNDSAMVRQIADSMIPQPPEVDADTKTRILSEIETNFKGATTSDIKMMTFFQTLGAHEEHIKFPEWFGTTKKTMQTLGGIAAGKEIDLFKKVLQPTIFRYCKDHPAFAVELINETLKGKSPKYAKIARLAESLSGRDRGSLSKETPSAQMIEKELMEEWKQYGNYVETGTPKTTVTPTTQLEQKVSLLKKLKMALPKMPSFVIKTRVFGTVRLGLTGGEDTVSEIYDAPGYCEEDQYMSVEFIQENFVQICDLMAVGEYLRIADNASIGGTDECEVFVFDYIDHDTAICYGTPP
jgi:predicted unusual protein kinase regulating ubiquinone biosynthesis (AarF/ABC1/UbiB family)